jgi:hypothetical protein
MIQGLFSFPKRLRFAVVIAILALTHQQVLATYSRVESMGKSADFFMDDVSIFSNPANMNIFPNFLIGEMGSYKSSQLSADSGRLSSANMDPANSWFGGIFSYSLGKHGETPSLYPQISLGGAFNRVDDELFALVPDSANGQVIPKPATNFDGFLGITLSNGGMLGSHIYIAKQEGADLGNSNKPTVYGPDIRVSALRADLGANWPVARNMDAELSLGTALVGYGPSSVDPELSFFVKGRAFSTLEIINGELVPMFNYSHLGSPGKEVESYKLGLGVNVSLDRGFFWLGAQGFLNHSLSKWTTVGDKQVFSSKINQTQSEDIISGVVIDFGIERNVWWDWFVVRVGGQKVIAYREMDGPLKGDKQSFFYTNPTGNTTPEDHVGFGIGLNIEEKLKVDATLAEDILYTFGNLFSKPQDRIISRISATYSF